MGQKEYEYTFEVRISLRKLLACMLIADILDEDDVAQEESVMSEEKRDKKVTVEKADMGGGGWTESSSKQ